MNEHGGDNERAAVPVIGIVLMVAIAVILGVLTGTLMLDLGTDVDENAQAGVSVNAEGGDIVVSYISEQRDSVSLDVEVAGNDEGTLSEAGESKRISGYSGQTRVVVTATDGDTTTVVYDNEVLVS